MRLRLWVILFAIAALTAFVILNWPVFIAPTPLSLGFASYEAPLGVVMLALVVGMSLVFAAYMAVWQSTILMDARRQAKEIQAQRTLAEQEETSRFSELRTTLHSEFEQMSKRLETSQLALSQEIRDNVNSLAAILAEMDDRAKPHP
ncbi:LapA family protein [Candidatus Aalborgicola defluviihabitans]|jgi:uncharacterized integral membrane protein|uniref:LapA family protein n=1 Tax=Candidatus Aalborgicola defluviihabitans TaxID=3386187 RepID=UPI001D6B3416|nr:LapA family protein [Burkholderiales bacterium]MBK6567922.1 LapA family protein [Burkholderiales bacterium]MBK7313302.1 LapA family protein [Burkholderiales bacterium]MBL0244577.1 LapA family protein [Rhodoferax sp.]